MPYVEDFGEFAKRMSSEYLRVRGRYLFANGAQSNGQWHEDPPSHAHECRKLQKEFLQHKLKLHTDAFKRLRKDALTQAEWHKQFGRLVAPPASEQDLDELTRLQGVVADLQAEIELIDKELRRNPSQEPTAATRLGMVPVLLKSPASVSPVPKVRLNVPKFLPGLPDRHCCNTDNVSDLCPRCSKVFSANLRKQETMTRNARDEDDLEDLEIPVLNFRPPQRQRSELVYNSAGLESDSDLEDLEIPTLNFAAMAANDAQRRSTQVPLSGSGYGSVDTDMGNFGRLTRGGFEGKDEDDLSDENLRRLGLLPGGGDDQLEDLIPPVMDFSQKSQRSDNPWAGFRGGEY